VACHRIAALLIALATAGCFDPAAERTRRDFEETGRAELGDVRARIDQGVALTTDPARSFVRFRANAPAVELVFASGGTVERRVSVELLNVFDDVEVSVPAAPAGENAVAFGVTVPPGGETRVTVRRPGADTPAPFRFAWVGDVQGGNERFTRIRSRIHRDPSLEFVVFAGDITERGTQEQIDAFLAVAEPLDRPWYSCLGNHESLNGEPLPFQRTVGRLNVRFDYRGARFVLFDDASGTLDERVFAFVRGAMEAGGPPARIAAMHIPPFDPSGLRDGGFPDRSEAARLLGVLARGGTDLLLAGHIHTLIETEMAGIPAVVSGNGGVGRGAAWDGSDMHFLEVSVDPAAGTVEARPVHVE
jgi:Icc protein